MSYNVFEKTPNADPTAQARAHHLLVVICLTAGVLCGVVVVSFVVAYHRAKENSEFMACVQRGGSTLSRHAGVTCRLPGETADARSLK